MTERVIAVLTTGRQDWGILRSTCAAIRATDGLRLWLIAGGMHLSAAYGMTVEQLRVDGFAPDSELAWLAGDGDRDGDRDDGLRRDRDRNRAGAIGTEIPAADQAAAALAAVGAELAAHRPAALLVAGDRLETAAAAVAATLAGVPLIHLHGGEQTEGAFDDALRHAITKLSHLHLVSHPEHADRVVALGEDPATVHVVGAPGLDNAGRDDLPDRTELAASLGIELAPPVVIVTVHPATLATDQAGLAAAVAEAMDAVPATYVITLPNSDPEAGLVRAALLSAAAGRPDRVAVDALGERRYWGLLRVADAMLGNSSSGLIEAPAVGLPVVNVGDRQKGRRRDANIVDVPAEGRAVAAALRRALEPATRIALGAARRPLADGRAGERIARIIAAWTPPDPPRKRGLPTPMRAEPVVVIGAGEHARVVVDALRARAGAWDVLGVVDRLPAESAEGGRDASRLPHLGTDEAFRATLASQPADARPRLVLGIGAPTEPNTRRAVVAAWDGLAAWATVVHPAAIVSADATLGEGTVVLAGALVGPGARIGNHAIVNTGAIVEHDVELGPFAQIGPGAAIGGGARIGAGSLVGLGARVRDHVTVGADAIVGMGAVVVADVPDGVTVMGTPARPSGPASAAIVTGRSATTADDAR
ncbi:MAG: hypothetical protein QOF49_516 [Chloroflexota bacterium]|nr:hypothetical protein [Chloroflexota bacterium]